VLVLVVLLLGSSAAYCGKWGENAGRKSRSSWERTKNEGRSFGDGWKSSGGGGCFIATACYGTPMAKDVIVLSKFRDAYLLTNATGRLFVKTYYKTSPPIADFIAKHPILKSTVRVCLKPLVWISITCLPEE